MLLLQIKTELLISMPSGGEWLWIILIVLLLFGGKKLPELARGLGKGIREFNDAKDGMRAEMEKGMKDARNSNATAAENPGNLQDPNRSTDIPTPPQA